MGPINVFFVCGGKYHDTDFVRLEMLKLFAGKSALPGKGRRGLFQDR